jgi:hypothetical protein
MIKSKRIRWLKYVTLNGAMNLSVLGNLTDFLKTERKVSCLLLIIDGRAL